MPGPSRLALLVLGSLLVACARPSAAPASPAPPDAPKREGEPPRYKPSSKSATAIPITTNAYGAFVLAPDAPKIGDRLPDFEVALVDGGTFRLAEARAAGPVA